MGKKIKTARGDTVDFDLLKIKQKISSAPTPSNVKARQEFVDKKLRRRYRKTQRKGSSTQELNQVNVDKSVPDSPEQNEEIQKVDEKQQESTELKTEPEENKQQTTQNKTRRRSTRKTTRQKARPKTNNEGEDENQSNT